MKRNINYIRHQAIFFQRSDNDARMRPHHIALYMALFRVWNERRFRNNIPLNRSRLMHTSKIGTQACYKKCIIDLAEWEYICLHQPVRPGGIAHVSIMELTGIKDPPETSDIFIANEIEFESKTIPDSVPLIIKQTNENKNEKEKVTPSLTEASAYFFFSGYSEKEAKKFFAHYQTNGWRQGGRTPIEDWQAAADKWILNMPYRKKKKRNDDDFPPDLPDYGTPL